MLRLVHDDAEIGRSKRIKGGYMEYINVIRDAIWQDTILRLTCYACLVDICFGILRAVKERKINSCIGIDGMIRKASMIISIVMLVVVDLSLKLNVIGFLPAEVRDAINMDRIGISDAFSLLYLGYESLSILKNMTLCGLPVKKIWDKAYDILDDYTDELPSKDLVLIFAILTAITFPCVVMAMPTSPEDTGIPSEPYELVIEETIEYVEESYVNYVIDDEIEVIENHSEEVEYPEEDHVCTVFTDEVEVGDHYEWTCLECGEVICWSYEEFSDIDDDIPCIEEESEYDLPA